MEQLLNLVNNTAVCGQVDALFNDLAEHIQEIAVVQMFIKYLWFEFPVGQKHRYTIIWKTWSVLWIQGIIYEYGPSNHSGIMLAY